MVEPRLVKLCRDNKAETHCRMSTVISPTSHTPTKTKAVSLPSQTPAKKTNRRSKRRKKALCTSDAGAEDYDIQCAGAVSHEQVVMPLPPQPLVPPPLSPEFPGATSISAPVQSKCRKKRKARNIQPTVRDNSSSEDPRPGSAPLLAAHIDSDSLTPLPSDCEDASDSHPPLSSASAPVRANPRRHAANRQRLSAMVQTETQYHARSAASDAFDHQAITLSADHTNAPMLGHGRQKRHKGNKQLQEDTTVLLAAPPSSLPAVPDGATLRPHATPASIPRRPRAPKAANSAKTPNDTVKRPVKKSKSNAGRGGHIDRLLLEAQWAGAEVPYQSNAATNTGHVSISMRTRAQKSAASGHGQEPTGRAHPIEQSAKVSRRKRPRGVVAAEPTQITHCLPKAARKTVPLPKRKSTTPRRLQVPTVQQDTLGMDVRDIDTVIRDSAKTAADALHSTADVADEWGVDDPRVQLVYPDSHDDEGTSHRVPHHDLEDHIESAGVCASTRMEVQNEQLQQDETPGIDDGVGIPSGPATATLKVPLPAYPPIWAEVCSVLSISLIYSCTCSLVKRCASHLTTSAATKVACISKRIW